MTGATRNMDKIPASSNPKYTIPEPRAATVRRQRLLDFLHGNIEQPLQLICAPAGYGKTTLLADFAKDTDLTVCWYSIDELDRDPRSFLTHLSEAIETRIAAFGDPNELMIDQVSGINMDWQSMVPGIVEGIRKRIREFFVLIVDDFHILTGSEAVTESLDLLIQQLPDNCRVIISTREIPHLASLPRLISQRMVSGLGPTELKFNIDEIKDLLKKNFDLEVSTEEAERLEQESEGWITSILLTTHSLWKGLFKEVLVNRGQNSLLFEYMASEVFSQQPPKIQKYLLNTSICNEFDAELGDALTDGLGQNQILQEIEYRNLFVTRLKGPNPWYRYHHLFRDYLREKLKREDPEGFLRLYAKAGDHFLSKGDLRQAIHFYLLGSEFEKALGLLKEQAESLSQEGLWDTLGNWLEQIPTELRATRPKLLLHLSTVYFRKGKHDEAIRLLNDIIEVFRKEEEHILEAQALTRRSVALRYKGAHQMAVRDARQALSLAQDHGIPIDEADARSSLGTAYAKQGKFPRAEREFKLALESCQEHGSLFQLTDIHSRIALVYVYIGDSAKAITHFEQARQGWQTLNNQSSLGLNLSNMAYFYCEQGRYEDAEPLALEAISLAQTAHSIRNEAQALDELTEILREQGRYEEALKSYERALELARQCMETPLVSRLCIGFGETYRRTGDNHKAKSLIKEGMALASDLGQDFELGMGCTSLGVIEYTSQNSEEGIALLQRACQLFDRSKQKRNLARAKFHLRTPYFKSRDIRNPPSI